jgi:ubiquinone/menaquinone biosynthesis C-methylase UbiE
MPSESVIFDRAAGYYDQTRGFPPGVEQDVAAMLARAGGFTNHSRILEIGVGTGRIALPLAAHVRQIVGADLSRQMMQRLREKRTTEPIALIEADATRLPFAAHTFDGAVVVHVFHLIAGWRDVLRELARVLRPDAPLLHARNHRTDDASAFKPIDDALNAVLLPERRTQRVGMQEHEEETFLTDQGWRRMGTKQVHHYQFPRTPNDYLSSIEGRVWSSTWKYTDDEHTRAVEAVKQALAQHYPDPDTPLTVDTGFEVEAFLPPVS